MAVAKSPIVANFEDGHRRYMEQIKRFPYLSAADELKLANRVVENGDPKAAETLINCHLRLVAKTAMRYRGYGLPVLDIISEGNLGLMNSVGKFDPSKGFRFSTYAMWWIRASIQEYILKNWSLVKIGTTANQKKLFFNLRRLKAKLNALGDGTLSPTVVKQISKTLGVTTEEVHHMDVRLSGDSSLNSPLKGSEGDSGEWMDFLQDDREGAEHILVKQDEYEQRSALLRTAMQRLTDRERRILVARRLEEDHLTLEDLAVEFSVSRERIRQIEVNAVNKISKIMHASVQADDLYTQRRRMKGRKHLKALAPDQDVHEGFKIEMIGVAA